ncbi:MAG: hypothetical protein QF792_08440 [Phycisphaerae bacterium]|nr:hypothetical protein [Phycisphaerae bacterium]
MALRFFRKRQKMIIIIMVFLMVSFLVGFQGFSALLRPRRAGVAVGESKYGKVSHADLSLAESDMGILGRYVGLTVRSREFLELWSRNGKRAELAYALLLQEARDSGGRISEEYVDAYLRQVGVSEDDYNTILSRLRAHQKVGERALRSAVARWLGVMWGFRAKQVGVPPSEPHIKRIFRDLNEKISLRVLEIPAEQFIKDMPEPSEDEILKQFNSYRQATRGEYPSVNSFGFGYHQGNRVRVSYLFVDQEVIGRVVRPAPRVVREYWREHKAEFTKKVPSTSTQAAGEGGAAAEAAASQPATTTAPREAEVQMTLDEAWMQVVERLSRAEAEEKVGAVVQQVQAKVQAFADDTSRDVDVYKWTVKKMIRPADKALAVMVPKETIAELRGKGLDKAVAVLAKATGLRAICYPWETAGEYYVSRVIRVPEGLRADKDHPLGVVLQEITRLVFSSQEVQREAIPQEKKDKDGKKEPGYPQLDWAMCQGFDEVLFPVGQAGGMRILPLKSGRTELDDRDELARNELLGAAGTLPGQGQRLLDVAFNAKPFDSDDSGRSQMELHEPGRVMYVGPGRMGRLLWRIIEAEPAHVLDEPTAEVRQQVVKDLKILKAFATGATDSAEKIKKHAEEVGLEAAAKAQKMETTETGAIARLVSVRPAQWAYWRALQQGADQQQARAQAEAASFLEKPIVFLPPGVRGVFAPRAAGGHFLVRAFELVPADVDRPLSADEQGPLAIVPMPTIHSVFVIQRVGYTPAVVGDFEDTQRARLAGEMLEVSKWRGRVEYFACDNIIARTHYEEKHR